MKKQNTAIICAAVCLLAGCEVIEYHVNGAHPEVVDVPPGYTHEIANTGDTELVSIIWCNECFDPNRPDTYREPVDNA